MHSGLGLVNIFLYKDAHERYSTAMIRMDILRTYLVSGRDGTGSKPDCNYGMMMGAHISYRYRLSESFRIYW